MKMLRSVFKSYGSIRTVLRNFRLNSYLSSAGGVITKERNVLLFKVPGAYEEKTTEPILKLKYIPEGYKLIYRSNDLEAVALARVSMVCFFAAGTWFAVQIYLEPDFTSKEGFIRRQEVALFLYIQVLIAYIFATKSVYYIFRNGNSYKTVLYGLFGKWQPRIINHQNKELILPNKNFPFFYQLKGNSVIMSSSGFINDIEFAELKAPYQPK